MKILLKILLIGLLAAVVLSACAGQVNMLYGSWRSAQSGLTLEFRQNGQMVMTSQGTAQEAFFELTGANSDTLVLKPAKDAPADQGNSINMTINGDTLTLMVSGQPQEFTRLK